MKQSHSETSSIMAREARETPAIVLEQHRVLPKICQAIVDQITNANITSVMMIGRGSSDHAGVFAKYFIESEIGLPVSAAAPSICGVYGQTLQLQNTLAIAISQSGRSPDLIRQAQSAKDGGAILIAIVNDTQSPLANLADHIIPVLAGSERAVAATKSFMATLTAIAHLVSAWKRDTDLLNGLADLPGALHTTIRARHQLNPQFIKPLTHCIVLGRGFGYAIGREIALKLKEVCSVHAEAFSSAEFVHGPITLAEKSLSVLGIVIRDESLELHQHQLDDVVARGAKLVAITPGCDIHPRLQPLLVLQRFYLDIEAIAKAMNLNPDIPPGLKKVTETI